MADAEQVKSGKESIPLPPYISYSSLVSFLAGLKESGVPSRIDRSVLKKMSGSQQSGLLAALRYLSITDSNDKPLELFKQIVDADEKTYSSLLKAVLTKSYAFLAEGGIDLESATGAQVAEAFRNAGASGSTVSKAMSFFIAAAKDAGIKLSSHIKAPTVPRANGSKKTARAKFTPPEIMKTPVIPHHAPQVKSLEQQLMEKFPAFDPEWDAETQKKWFDNFATLMDMSKGK